MFQGNKVLGQRGYTSPANRFLSCRMWRRCILAALHVKMDAVRILQGECRLAVQTFRIAKNARACRYEPTSSMP